MEVELNMVNFIQGFFINVVQPIEGSLDFTTDPFPQGTNVWANISLSTVNTAFEGKLDDPTFAAIAWVNWWTTYNPDGGESAPQGGDLDFQRNAVGIQNVARINFMVFAERAEAIAQINVFGF